MQLADELLKSFAKITNDKKVDKSSTAIGTVHISNNETFVQLDGSEEFTPVETTAGNKHGDRVLVSIKNHKATILGNYTDPSTPLSVSNGLTQRVSSVEQIAGNTNQYFWHTETGTDTGAHITEIPQEDFLAAVALDPTDGGGNLLARSNGIAVRDGLIELAKFTGSSVTLGLTSSYNTYISSTDFRIRNNGSVLARFTGSAIYFYDGLGTSGTNVLASFGANDSVIGQTSDLNIRITSGAVQFRSGTTTVGKISVDDVPTGTVGMFFNLGKNNYISSYYEASGNSNQIWISASRYQSGSNETSDIFLDSYGGIYLMASHNIISLQTGDYIDLSAPVYSTSNIYAGGTVYTSGKVAIDDGTAGIALGAGNMRLASASDPKIYFYRNSGTSPSSNLTANGNGLLTASGSFAVGSVQSYTPTWSISPDDQTPVRYQCIVSAGICSFWYMGAAVAHSASTTLCTLPTGARPTAQVMAPFVKMSGGVVGCISITTAGVVSVNQISSTTNTGRIYFNVSFPVV